MKIGINCRSFINRKYTGIGRYASNLVRDLTRIDQENNYFLYVPKSLFNTKKVVPKVIAKNFFVKVDRFKLGLYNVLKPVDIFHSPCPDIIHIKCSKVIVTVHDLIYKTFPEGHTKETLRLSDLQFQSFIPIAAKIICPSQSTARDLQRYFQVGDEKIAVVYQGVDKDLFYPLEVEEKIVAAQMARSKGVNAPFIFFVGTIEPRKNLKNLFQAFSILKNKNLFRGKLVAAGMMGWKSEDIIEVAGKLGIKNDVIFLGFVTNEELRCFYNLAEVFVFPSFYEGFGYPIIEAFSCGAAVVASDVSSCSEIAGGAALFVDPHNPQKIASAIEQIIGDQDFKKELSRKAIKRAEEFDCLKTAKKTLEVYKEVYFL